jgi:nicotinamide-nucleotide adenylyltransferase
MTSGRPLEGEAELLRKVDLPTLVVEPDPHGKPESIGLLSGSFDPMTVAHAALAEAGSTRVGLMLLVYSVRTLPKEGNSPPSLLEERHRLQVLERYCRRRSRMAVGLCSHGLLADQVEAARTRFPGSALWLVMGSDKVLQLLDPRWYRHRDVALTRLFAEAGVMYAARTGEDEAVGEALNLPANRRWRDRFERLDVPGHVASVSSRRVRELLRSGQDASHLVVEEGGE